MKHQRLFITSVALLALALPQNAGGKKPQSLLPQGFSAPQQAAPEAVQEHVQELHALDEQPVATPKKSPQSHDAERSVAAKPLEPNFVKPMNDLPAAGRLSLAKIGLITPAQKGFAPNVFAKTQGAALEKLMRNTKAPIASRWMSILLRRLLVSEVNTPVGLSGADWTAERAWLLLRMGEAKMAAQLLKRVDTDNYTPKLKEVAMQSALANGDVAAMCPLASQFPRRNATRAWLYSKAICNSLTKQSSSGGILSLKNGKEPDLDKKLAIRLAGAGAGAHQVIDVDMSGAQKLTAWRFGAAAALGLPIPANLYDTAQLNVRGWAALSPMIKPADKMQVMEQAAGLGIISSTGLVEYYASFYDDPQTSNASNSTQALLNTAYVNSDFSSRYAALGTIWDSSANDELQKYARIILTARACYVLPIDKAYMGRVDKVVASLLSVGLDTQAAKWLVLTQNATDSVSEKAWGLLAVGAPSNVPLAQDRLNGLAPDSVSHQFLIAGLAGLDRLDYQRAKSFAIGVSAQTPWTNAIDLAAAHHETGLVLLLAAAGLQDHDWHDVPPAHLFHIVRALRAVGLEPEARMVAAEALMRV
jgi:hypothetical protein